MRLERLDDFSGVDGPVLLVVMDGVGIGRGDFADAVSEARTPNLDRLKHGALYTELVASGTAVGLPSDSDMGNSEVGHNAIGAGRVIDQGAKRVALAIENGEIFKGNTWKQAVGSSNEKTLHFIGLLSDGGVHSHEDHLYAMLRAAKKAGVSRVRVHPLLDGRDVGEKTALTYIARLEHVLSELRDAGVDAKAASGGGRMTTTMDRYEADWSIVQRGYHAHVHGTSDNRFVSLTDAVTTLYEQTGEADQFLPEFVIEEDGSPVGRIESGDAVIFFNFRGDRALEITRAFTETSFSAFDRGEHPDVFYAGMMEYDGDLKLPERYLVDPPSIDRTLGEHLARSRVHQFACSETQKFGHVTYFWNGNRSGKFDETLENYVEIESDRVPFEQRPWMKAAEITDATLDALATGTARFLRINYANGDMVGHTGHLDASIIAVETVDLQLGRLMEAMAQIGGALIVTADHGNADLMVAMDKKTGEYKRTGDGDFERMTSHTLNPVPCSIWLPQQVEPQVKLAEVPKPSLTNLAATVLFLLGFEAPVQFDESLLKIAP